MTRLSPVAGELEAGAKAVGWSVRSVKSVNFHYHPYAHANELSVDSFFHSTHLSLRSVCILTTPAGGKRSSLTSLTITDQTAD